MKQEPIRRTKCSREVSGLLAIIRSLHPQREGGVLMSGRLTVVVWGANSKEKSLQVQGDPRKRRSKWQLGGDTRSWGKLSLANGNVGLFLLAIFFSLPLFLTPKLGSLPWACWGLSMPFKVPGSPPLLRLPHGFQQKPPFLGSGLSP